MNIYDFYIQQSSITNPGNYVSLFDNLESEIPYLCDLVQGLILHYADEEIFNYKIPKNRFEEMDARYVQTILDLILQRDSRALNMLRQPDKRVIGVCRDNSALVCSILRHKKIPARLRVGFVDYIIPGIYLDGVCVEYWNHDQQKWCLVDTRTAPIHIEKYKINLDSNLHDLQQGERFLTASEAWNRCRAKKINPNRFGSRMHRGLWYVRNRLLQDFAFLNKQEVLIWDLWGMMLAADSSTEPYVVKDCFK